MTNIEELLTHIVSSIVDDASAIQIESIPSDHTTILKLSVAKEDTGKVIGKVVRQRMRFARSSNLSVEN